MTDKLARTGRHALGSAANEAPQEQRGPAFGNAKASRSGRLMQSMGTDARKLGAAQSARLTRHISLRYQPQLTGSPSGT